MAYGDLKCNNLIYETGSGDVTIPVNTVPSTAGATFTGDVTLTGAANNVVWDVSDNALEFADDAKATFGASDLQIYHDQTNSLITNATGYLGIRSNTLYLQDNNGSGHAYLTAVADGAVGLRYDNIERLATTDTGVNVTGLTVAGASDFTGKLTEAVVVTAGELSATPDLNIESGNVFLFTTAESTTSTPNLRYNGSTTLDSKMAVGDCLSVTIITTANASGFSAQLTIDGAAVTENWTGGSAPSAGGSSGVDIHAYTIIKTASNTYTVIANHTKTS